MKTPDAKAPPPSLFHRYVAALRLDGRPMATDEGALRLAATLAAMDLPPLALPLARRPAPVAAWRSRWAVAAALAVMAPAAAYFATSHAASDSPYRSKGASAVKVYWEHAGQVKEFTGAERLANGDRIQAEVLSPEAGVAFWGAFDGQGTILGSWDQVQASRTPLLAGKRAPFNASLQLVGANEGETLVVIVCPGNGGDHLGWDAGGRDGLVSSIQAMIIDKVNTINVNTCKVSQVKLR